MRFTADWDAAVERWTALWSGRALGRPCITVTAPLGLLEAYPAPVSGEQRWLDPDYIVGALRHTFATTYYGGEAFPSGLLMGGWVANTYGATPRFPLETIWFDPIAVDWDRPPAFAFDWDSPWFAKVLAVHKAVLAAAGRNDFLVGGGCFMPANDMLALVMGAETMLLGLKDHPQWIRAALAQLADNRVAVSRYFQRLAAPMHDFWYGNGGWMPIWGPAPFIATQSDISCMLSPETFDEFVLPELELLGREFGNVWYHLDGQSAFQHLPRLLAQPYLRVMQFTPEAGTPPNGPHYLDFYRKVQQAGKIVHIQLPPTNVESLARQLDPGLLCMDTWCVSPRDAGDLLSSAVRWCRAGR